MRPVSLFPVGFIVCSFLSTAVSQSLPPRYYLQIMIAKFTSSLGTGDKQRAKYYIEIIISSVGS